ncbi:MAG: hypothetical protein CVV21_05835 [Candidatus Goldiibacteriota bacterium HGW-Goldbacteria-1]|jgi:hypothetical protein|nr:MAG: hypothetical protein CVV21_05835 [Candidatus Goldiibacteriota bacterium HGW-Goldbacteria-1]
MENTSDRIQTQQSDNTITIEIKPYNTMFNALLSVFVTGFFAGLLFIAIMTAATLLYSSGSKIDLNPMITITTAVYALIGVFFIARAAVWTLFGKEEIIITGGAFYYKKSALIKLKEIKVNNEEILEFKLTDYFEPKDLFYAVKAEFGFLGRSFTLKTAAYKLRFGICLNIEELRVLESFKEFKTLLKKT